jgi:hypothetical protein
MLNLLTLLAGVIVVLLLLALDANLKRAIARQNALIPLGVWARLNLIFDVLFGRLDWLGEHVNEQGLWYLDRTIKLRRLLMLVVAIYVVLAVAVASSASSALTLSGCQPSTVSSMPIGCLGVSPRPRRSACCDR